jgi:hypothetical protein
VREWGGTEGKSLTGLVGVIDIEEGQVVSFWVDELSFGLVGLLPSVDRAKEDVWDCCE